MSDDWNDNESCNGGASLACGSTVGGASTGSEEYSDERKIARGNRRPGVRGAGRSRGRGSWDNRKEGHMSSECNNSSSHSKPGCYKCGVDGHMSRDCPNFSGGDSTSFCNKKSGEGHNKTDCLNPTQEESGLDGKPRPPLYVPEHVADEQLFFEGVKTGINFDAYENIPVAVNGKGFIPPRLESFEDANLRPLLLDNVKRAGYGKPTPIQRHCIPAIMAGRDIMGCAQTGSGKTAAFLLPILHKIIESGAAGSSCVQSVCEPECVIVAPTRELAIQIHNEGRKFAMSSMVRVVVCYGGASVSSQFRSLQAGCSVLVATPGRLMDFLDKGRVGFTAVKFVVLDEADRMLDMGFVSEIEKMMNHHSMPALKDRQTLLFSATFPEEVQILAGKYLNNYVFYVIGMVGAANTDVAQEVLNVPKSMKRETLVNKLRDIIASGGDNKVLVFVETKRTADFIASYLSTQGLNSTSIHGDRFQSQREEALSQFKNGIRSILVATSVAARGLDIRGVTHVLNYDLPKEADEYVHRIGRTGRVGNCGCAISFFDVESDAPIAKNLKKILLDAAYALGGPSLAMAEEEDWG